MILQELSVAQVRAFDIMPYAVPEERAKGTQTEERKNTRPDIDRTDVLFADGGVSYSSQKDVREWNIAWDPNNNSDIKDQLRAHLDEVNAMEPVASVNYDKTKQNYIQELNRVLKERFGYKISRILRKKSRAVFFLSQRGLLFIGQFFSEWIGAGMRPPREMNLSGETVLISIMGA